MAGTTIKRQKERKNIQKRKKIIEERNKANMQEINSTLKQPNKNERI